MMSRRTLAIVAGLSIAVNLFLGGIVAGRWIKDEGRGRGGGFVGAYTLLRSLSDERRTEIEAVIGTGMKDVRAQFRAAREVQGQVTAALAAEPFDPAALRTALAASRAAFGGAVESSADIMVRVAEQMTPAERAALVQNLKERSERRRDRKSD